MASKNKITVKTETTIENDAGDTITVHRCGAEVSIEVYHASRGNEEGQRATIDLIDPASTQVIVDALGAVTPCRTCGS